MKAPFNYTRIIRNIAMMDPSSRRVPSTLGKLANLHNCIITLPMTRYNLCSLQSLKSLCSTLLVSLCKVNGLVSWFYFTSHRQRRHLETAPHLLSLAKDVKLGKYTVHTGNRTPGLRVNFVLSIRRRLMEIRFCFSIISTMD